MQPYSPGPVILVAVLLTVRGVRKTYRRSWLSRSRVTALAGVDLALEPGARLALVGSSGSGKSTLAKCAAGWETADSGEIRFAAAGRPQLIPQHPGDSLNPWFRAAEIVGEPLRIRGKPRRACRAAALDWMERTGLPSGAADRRPSEFSGGERARLAMARALAATGNAEPALLIFDESFSGLDLPLQAQLLDLLGALQASLPLAYLLVAHDLSLAARFASEIAVMHAGRIVEQGPAAQVMTQPRSEHARRLIAAMPGRC